MTEQERWIFLVSEFVRVVRERDAMRAVIIAARVYCKKGFNHLTVPHYQALETAIKDYDRHVGIADCSDCEHANSDA